MSYQSFVSRKLSTVPSTGISGGSASHESLFPHQSALVAWALQRGRAAIFADTGLGKSRMQLSWADAVVKHTNGRVLILAPLAVAAQTVGEGAAEVIAALRRLGVKRMIMLSGDNQGVADAIAAKLGLTDARGGLMPEDKVAFIKALREQAGGVAMVGDGVNDAPAMANATVGIAMGAAGSDVALETADVALMADDLRRLPFAVSLSRQTSAIIKQNLLVSLGMVAFLIPATIFGLKIGAAVVFHEGSTLLVVFNALRLLGHRDKP